ncbi:MULTISPECIES: histidine phosphotransferase ChpT [Euryhalocaulis]|uniref:histidine phosphotransferase ChpT n=1 Tax=Euryhalocaulis TaxID=1712422 RepID=UPI00039AD280|nr:MULTISPECIES: histidine phosphotransferase family protein [Euryhalocaulis]MBA4802720.1 ATP-binding protein [Euryhalocaulis sp.]
MSEPVSSADLAALLSARLCHDLIGPVGATISAVSVFDDPDAADMRDDAIALIRESAEKSRARLEFCRLAFGAGGSAPGVIELASLQRLTGDMYAGSKAGVVWKVEGGGLEKRAARVLLNLILIAMESAPRGGEVRIEASESAGETRLRVTAAGPRAKLLPAAADALTGQAPEGGFDGRSIQPYYIYLIIQEVGGRVDAQTSEDRVELTALVPGA